MFAFDLSSATFLRSLAVLCLSLVLLAGCDLTGTGDGDGGDPGDGKEATVLTPSTSLPA